MTRVRWLVVVLALLVSVAVYAQEGDDSLSEACAFDREDFTTLFDNIDAARDGDDIDAYIETILALRRAIDLKLVLCYTSALDAEVGQTRANPVAFGDADIVKTFEDVYLWRVASFNEDATETVMQTASSYDAPTEGTKYITAQLVVTCDKLATESCEVASRRVGAVGSNGVGYEAASVSGYVDDFEIFGGGQITINVAFLVQEADSNFVLFNLYTSYDDEVRTYFATK